MILSKLELYDFRKFKSVDEQPGLSISFHKGLNALIGENDSGKTAVIDAIKLALLTQSSEYIRVMEDDFYTDSDGNSVNEFRINLVISDFAEQEAKNFIEYLSYNKNGDGVVEYYLQLYYRAWKDKNRIYSEIRAGDRHDGVIVESKARELLKTVYLKPLRDAEHEMRSGRNSRISQILISHPVFQDKEENELVDILKTANNNISNYFTDDDGKAIMDRIRKTLKDFSDQDSSNEAKLATSSIKLKAILESLSLLAPEIRPGLGELNLLFIAAELLLLTHDDAGGLKLALIEELEAHLHPQAQLRLIEHLQKEYRDSGAQIIISTHSTILASKINLKNMILVKNGIGYDLAPGNTKLLRGDYLFLQRFLDVTKANMFFAKGIIMVEGDAENLIIPIIADIIGYPLEKHGISIVNVGSTAFLRYSKIFARADDSTIQIPVSVVTDCDVKPTIDDEKFNPKDAETKEALSKKQEKYTLGNIKAFVSPRWTLEYSLALSCLKDIFHRSIYYAKKIRNNDEYTLTLKERCKIEESVAQDCSEWSADKLPANFRACKLYGLMLEKDGSSKLKAIAAQCFTSLLHLSFVNIPSNIPQENDLFDFDMLQWTTDEAKKSEWKEKIEQDEYLAYLVSAIKHAAGVNQE